MNVSENKIIPYRIKQARITRGFSMAELADLVGVSKQAISQYEQGKHEPSFSTLNRLSDILKYPYSFFTKPIQKQQNASSPVFFRSRKTAAKKNLNAAREKIEIFSEINNYLSKYVIFPELELPKIKYLDDSEPLDNEIIERYALELRHKWNLGVQPINNLISLIQSNGIMVSKMELRLKKIDAFSVWYDAKPYIFLSSDKGSNVRTRFDMAHELGHLIMHADYFQDDELDNKTINTKLEDEANRFAGAFLLPRESFSKDVRSTSIDFFIQLKRKWKVSISAMIFRCETLGLLTSSQIKYLKDQMTKRVYWRREPLDDEMPSEKPFAHKQAIDLLLENNIIQPSELINATGCYASELEAYCFLEKGTLSQKNTSNIIQLKQKSS